MKKEQVKRGMVVWDNEDCKFYVVEGEVYIGGTGRECVPVNSILGFSYLDDLRPLTARERGDTQ